MENIKNNFFTGLLKGVLIGLSACLAMILIFAFVLKFVAVPQKTIAIINGIIKLISICVACPFAVNGEKGLLKGAATGTTLIIVTYLLFGLISGELSFGAGSLLELLYGLVAGGLAGVICVNLKK